MFGFYRTALCVPTVRAADVEFNVQEIIALAKLAAEAHSSILLFPELALSSRSCGDLFFHSTLLEKVEDAVKHLCAATAKLSAILVAGAPVCFADRLFNAALVIQRGKILGVVPKTSPVKANEPRYFSSGGRIRDTVMDLAGQSGLPFGSDLLFDGGNELCFGVEIGTDGRSAVPPGAYLALSGATLLLNPGSGIEGALAADRRRERIKEQSRRWVAAYVCAGAGVHESTADTVCGGHCLAAENGSMLLDSPRFRRDSAFYTVDVDLARIRAARLANPLSAPAAELPKFRTVKTARVPTPGAKLIRRTVARQPFVPDSEEELRKRCGEIFAVQTAGLAKRLEHTGAKKAVLGVSGGLDSTLALLVCAATMKLLKRPATDILAVNMPGFGTTARTRRNAAELCRALKTEWREIEITASCHEHFRAIGHDEGKHDVTYENAQARERTQILMDVANSAGGLVVGTGDLSESALGWCTYNGDQMSMYDVNCSVPKTLIRRLITFAGEKLVPGRQRLLRSVIATPVSPELLPAGKNDRICQKTEDILGPYEVHDFFLYHFLKSGAGPAKLLFLARLAFGPEYSGPQLRQWLRTFLRRFFTHQFKRSCAPDGPAAGTVSLSPRHGWRMPSDVSFELWRTPPE